jgi:RNA-directed DNA polymerase
MKQAPRESGLTSIWSLFTREFDKPTKEAMQMTAETTTAGAASHQEVNWHAMNWQAVNQEVKRLQVRIVKAQQQGKWGKVKALQHLLTHSFSGKALAVKRVTENQGKRTPGVDGEIWKTPQKKAEAVETLTQRGYRPRPLRRIYIPKSNGGKRPLSIPTMKDRAMQALYLLALDPIAEVQADPNSYGFRKERGPADAIDQCHRVLSNRAGAEWILEGDIKACFDKISHTWLEDHILMDKKILRKWLKAGFIEKRVLKPTEEGTPQGGICSPALANLALDGLEAKLREKYPKASNASRKAKANLVRFADDFIITGSSKELLENEIKPLVEQFMKERGLELSQEKTHITHIAIGFDFLGQNIRKYKDGKVLVKPSKKNVKMFLTKIRKLIKENAQATAGNLIVQLNPKIRGWANYHRHVSSKQTFVKVDDAIFRALWQWAKRRHPNKSEKWVKEKYFHSIGQRNWVFCGQVEEQNGTRRNVQLFYAHTVPIERHTKIKGDANPYDPTWEMYFEERLGVKMVHNLKGKRQLIYLWKEQNGLCPICHQKITKLTGWNNHHIVRKVDGGADQQENRVLLHPNCHRQVHSQGLSVAKPRPAKGR